MTVRIPSEYPGWLAEMTSRHFPRADEDAIRRLAGAWRHSSDRLAQTAHQLDTSVVADEVLWAALPEGFGSVSKASMLCVDASREHSDIAERLHEAAAMIENAKKSIIATADMARIGIAEDLVEMDNAIKVSMRAGVEETMVKISRELESKLKELDFAGLRADS
ncbi:hypothetical protein ACQP2U_24020 [Nocardia sp. CA-084685]|uniref:WXG100-like domain-containing protein n=1 Tax=Nocardia sp. CA-084685 TaxID=3239970 RepID=UPI003D9674DC